MNVEIKEKDEIVMKLLHYFITNKGYNPVILHGAQNEIWLENMEGKYKIIRIVSNYIHNNEQLNLDLFKTKRVVKALKRKTFNFTMDVLSIFTDLGENVDLESQKHIDCISLKEENDISKYDFVCEEFPDINDNLKFDETGMNLFFKITEDINEQNKKEAEIINNVFKPKKPIITPILIFINILIFLIGIIFQSQDYLINMFATYGPFIRMGDYYRLLSGAFIHVDLLHIFFNMYALSTIGVQVENFFGKKKFLIIYLFSAISGSLLSIIFNLNVASIGASGAIFGLLGALLYFGYYYRNYLGNVLVSQILPIMILNIFLGFLSTGIDNFAHIGGLVGGIIMASILTVEHKNSDKSSLNPIIIGLIFIGFLIFMNFFYIK